MESMDLLAFSFAVTAVALGLLITAHLLTPDRAAARAEARAAAQPPTRRIGDSIAASPDDHDSALSVRLAGRGSKLVWRFESSLDSGTISIDVFSQRATRDDAPGEWRHDLMVEPLMLAPGQTAELPAIGVGTRHEAAVGWFVGLSPERNRDSRFVSVSVSDRTATS